MNSNLTKISNNEALRICVKSKQISSSDAGFIKSIIKDKVQGISEEHLKVYLNNELANLNHMGFYLIKNSNKIDCILVPLHDESFLLIDSYTENDINIKICSGFHLLNGYSSLIYI